MYEDTASNQSLFKRREKMQKRGMEIRKLNQILQLLQIDTPLPLSARPHKLVGDWSGFWECHIEPDWLLIYTLEEDAIGLVRTGSHADLFT